LPTRSRGVTRGRAGRTVAHGRAGRTSQAPARGSRRARAVTRTSVLGRPAARTRGIARRPGVLGWPAAGTRGMADRSGEPGATGAVRVSVPARGPPAIAGPSRFGDRARIADCSRAVAWDRLANGARLVTRTAGPHASVRRRTTRSGGLGRSRVPSHPGRGSSPSIPANRHIRCRAHAPGPARVRDRRPLRVPGRRRLPRYRLPRFWRPRLWRRRCGRPRCGRPRRRRAGYCLPAHGPGSAPTPPGSRRLRGPPHPLPLRRPGGRPFPGLLFARLPFSGWPAPPPSPGASPDGLLSDGPPGDALRRGGGDRQCRPSRNRYFAGCLALFNALLLSRDGPGHTDLLPHPAEHNDLVFFRQRSEPAPGRRFPDVTRLGNDQLGQALTLQYRPGRRPGEQAGRQHVQPEQVVVERQTEQGQKDDVGHRNGGKNGNLANRQRHREPEIVQLV
jgi:hypothetical protein